MKQITLNNSKPYKTQTSVDGMMSLRDLDIMAPRVAGAMCLQVLAGGFDWSAIRVGGMYGALIAACKGGSWANGGSQRTKSYGAFIGDLHRGYASNVTLTNLLFGSSDGEACLRSMGADLRIDDCTFDQTRAPHTKQAVQIRHGIAHIINSVILGSAVFGPLRPGATGADAASIKSERIYLDFASKNPLRVDVENCTILGHVSVTGNSLVSFRACHFTGADPRKDRNTGKTISGSTAVNVESWSAGDGRGFWKPQVECIGCDFGPWKNPAANGVEVVK